MLHAEPFETKLLSAELCILFIYFLKGNCIGLEYHIILSKIHIIVIIKTKIIDQNKSCSNNIIQDHAYYLDLCIFTTICINISSRTMRTILIYAYLLLHA